METTTDPAELAATKELAATVRSLDRAVGKTAAAVTDAVGNITDATTLATMAALIGTLRSELVKLEGDLATKLGKTHGKHVGSLADGARYEVTRSADRKEWQHDDWKRDARRVIAEKVTARYVGLDDDHLFYDRETGEEVRPGRMIQEALTLAQEVHGSQAPRSKALTSLGLYASDYATSTPGPWRVAFIKPEAGPTATVQENQK